MALRQVSRNKSKISLNRLSLTTDFFCANLNPDSSIGIEKNQLPHFQGVLFHRNQVLKKVDSRAYL